MMEISFSPETIIMAFCFATLAACIFLRRLLVYLALSISWLAVIFTPGVEFPKYIQLVALAIAFFGVMSIFEIRGEDKL